MGRRVVAAVLAVVASVLLAHASPASAASRRETTEAEFVVMVNQLRAAKGLTELLVHPGLTDVARNWAAHMSDAGRISHRTDLIEVPPDPTWVKIGENVGVGGTVRSLHDAFVASPTHYRNLVDSAWHYIGVGVVYDGDTIYVAQNFMQVEKPPAAAPRFELVSSTARSGAVLSCSGHDCPALRYVARR